MPLKKQVGIAAIILVLIVAVMALFNIFRVHTDYAVLSTYEQESSQEDNYVAFHNTIIQYGVNGVTCSDAQNNTLWNQNYEMDRPIMAMSDSYIAIADQSGNDIWLFNESGYVTQITSSYQILQIAVSDKGNFAAIMARNKNCYLQLYDSTGELVAEGEAHLNDKGYPAAIAISSDGNTLAVSYFTVDTGSLSSTITFYDFGESQSNSDHIVASYTNDGLTIARLAYMDNGNFVAFGDKEVQIYSGSGAHELKAQIEPEGKIVSVFAGENRFGLVFQNQNVASGNASASADSSEGAYNLKVYSANGKESFTSNFGIAYESIFEMKNGQICIKGNSALVLISKSGRTIYTDSYEEPLLGIMPADGHNRYYLIFSNRAERIRLK